MLSTPGTHVSSTNKTDRYDITEILLKVGLNTINPSHAPLSKSVAEKIEKKTAVYGTIHLVVEMIVSSC